ncbi:hypothetical protein BGZ81_003937 [Podila clonocystis]|nr:hypothetical protein BGZ81_003937 [Podila clonocystis]
MASVSQESTKTATKPVFSLFLTPEQRKMKLEQAAAAAAEAAQARTTMADTNKGAKTRGRKPKIKAATVPTSSTPNLPPPKPTGPIVDPNISKTGETHRFFQEVKASSQLHSPGSIASGTGAANGSFRRYNQTPQEPALPQQHLQCHGSETIDDINGIVAKLCGLDTSSPSILEDLDHIIRPVNGALREDFGWRSLRASPDLGITSPEFKLKPRGKDCWTHWGNNRDQKWRNWSEKSHRLCKPTDQERKLLKEHSRSEEFESCHRLSPDQPLWQQTWASTLLATSGLSSDSEIPSDLKIGSLWTEKYRPTQGSEVLGNRRNTEYLTQWLQGLEVSGWTLNPEEQASSFKKSEVFVLAQKRRSTKKARRRDMGDMDDFIVQDDFDDFGDPMGYLSEEDDTYFSVPRHISSFTRLSMGGNPEGGRKVPKHFDIRSNTILLSGPSGSGKTAAVYACAEESGYEVFEVSPGTRRTGKEVLGLVGEMAENHHVHVVPGRSEIKEDIQSLMNIPVNDTPATKSGIHSFFQKPAPKAESEDEEMEATSDVDIEGDDDYMPGSRNDTPTTRSSCTPSEPSNDRKDEGSIQEDTLSDLYSLLATTNPRQSLILLEEVDILFEDDKGFWASIVTLISKSKRPVVMTCNDPSKVPPSTIRFQEHLEFIQPSLPELHHYLTMLCKIEGYICSSQYISSVIKSCRYDVRKSIMQLQYDAGLIRNRPTTENMGSNGLVLSPPMGQSPVLGTTLASPMKRKPQRLLRISSRGIVPASAPSTSAEHKSPSNLLKDLEQVEAQGQYAELMSLSDSFLQMHPQRVIQCYEADQFMVSKDDTVGQYLPIYKQPTGSDHLFLDQEISSLVEEGAESLYRYLSLQSGAVAYVFGDSSTDDDPQQQLARHFVPTNDSLSEFLRSVKPALEQTLSLHGLRFNLGTTFDTYLPALQSMVYAESISTVVPTGKRLMRSGGHLKRHLILSDDAYSSLLSSRLPIL